MLHFNIPSLWKIHGSTCSTACPDIINRLWSGTPRSYWKPDSTCIIATWHKRRKHLSTQRQHSTASKWNLQRWGHTNECWFCCFAAAVPTTDTIVILSRTCRRQLLPHGTCRRWACKLQTQRQYGPLSRPTLMCRWNFTDCCSIKALSPSQYLITSSTNCCKFGQLFMYNALKIKFHWPQIDAKV